MLRSDRGRTIAGLSRGPVGRLRGTIRRSVLSLLVVVAVILVIPRTPLEGPVGGVLALATVLACSWYGGPASALFFPTAIFLVSRYAAVNPPPAFAPTSREIVAFLALSVVTAATGLAGQYRRSLNAAKRAHRLKLEQQSRALSAASILFRDLEGRITTWPEGAHTLYGWSAEEATGQRLHELLRTEFPIPLEQIHDELLRNGQWRGELRHSRKDGRQLVVANHWILFKDTETPGESVAEVHNDVTALRDAEARVREADQRKDRFIAVLAHELRNPLAPIRSGIDLLQLLHTPSPEEAELFGTMSRQMSHLVRLIDELLDISRMNTGKITLQRRVVCLSEVLDDAVKTCQEQIDESGHQLSLKKPDAPVLIDCDPARLTQVMVNLIQNAAKFTDPGGRIDVEASLNGETLVLQVSDTGIGIPPEVQPRIFEMFAQVGDLVSRTTGGLGIGLSIVRNLVEMHGGAVQVESEGCGKGSKFTVHLPAVVKRAEHSQVNGSPPTNGATGQLRRRVLIVDDNRDAARMLSRALKQLGCHCEHAFDGDSALALAAQVAPEVFLVDLGMPGMSGLQLARHLRSDPKFQSSLLIAVTGWDHPQVRAESTSAGFDHHLAKPVEAPAVHRLLMQASR